jgi:hypothetical protein
MAKDSTKRLGMKNFDSLAVYYRTIFDHYHITAAQFESSLEWYKKNPDKLDTVYTAMIDKVTKLKGAEPQHTAPPRPVMPPPAAAHPPAH